MVSNSAFIFPVLLIVLTETFHHSVLSLYWECMWVKSAGSNPPHCFHPPLSHNHSTVALNPDSGDRSSQFYLWMFISQVTNLTQGAVRCPSTVTATGSHQRQRLSRKILRDLQWRSFPDQQNLQRSTQWSHNQEPSAAFLHSFAVKCDLIFRSEDVTCFNLHVYWWKCCMLLFGRT